MSIIEKTKTTTKENLISKEIYLIIEFNKEVHELEGYQKEAIDYYHRNFQMKRPNLFYNPKVMDLLDDIKKISKDFQMCATEKGNNSNSLFLVFNNIDIRDIKLPIVINENIDAKYPIIKEIRIQEGLGSDLLGKGAINRMDTSEKHDLTLDHLRRYLAVVSKKIDTITLQSLLSTILLTYPKSQQKPKFRESLGLSERYDCLKKLFTNGERLYHSDIEEIFIYSDTTDIFLIKQLLYLIHLKDSSRKYEELEKQWNGFKKDCQISVFASQFEESRIKLECYLKNDYTLEHLLEWKKIYDKNNDFLKVVIPLNPKELKFERVNPKIIEDLQKFYLENPLQILDIFDDVIREEFKRRFKLEFISLLVSFEINNSKDSIDDLKERGIYFNKKRNFDFSIGEQIDEIERMFKKKTYKIKTKVDFKDFERFIIYEGFYQTNRTKSSTNVFQIVDKHNLTLSCKIINNKKYFRTLKPKTEAKIQIIGVLKVKCRYDVLKKTMSSDKDKRHIEIIDLEIIDNFKPVKCFIESTFKGDRYLVNTRKGLSIYTYPSKGKTCRTILLRVPIILQKIFEGNDEFLYQVKLRDEVITKSKEGICEYLTKRTTLAYKSGTVLENAINNVLEEYKMKEKFIIYPIYYACGIFTDKKDNLIISHPFNEKIKVVGHNASQSEVIERVSRKGIDVNGDLVKDYFEILHIDNIDLNFRVGVYGFSAISNFDFVLKDILDINPLLFGIGDGGSGKTTLIELLINIPYGTILKNPTNINVSKISHYPTEATSPVVLDEIEDLTKEVIAFVKSNSTRLTSRDRLKQNSKDKMSEEIYASFAGSSNSANFLSGEQNSAFRMRALIFDGLEKIRSKTQEDKDKIRKFKSHKKNITSGKLFGYYLLEKAVEFIDVSVKGNLTTLDKLKELYERTCYKIDDLQLRKKFEFNDERRVSLYALIYVGLSIWDYIFKEHKLESEILNKFLNLDEEDEFFNFIDLLESKEREIALDMFNNIFYFFDDKKHIYGKYIHEEDYFLTTKFINDYDKFAREHGYDILKSLNKFAELQSQILNRKIGTESLYIKDEHGVGRSRYGVKFYYSEVLKLRTHNKISDEEIEKRKEGVDEETGKIDMDRIFAGESRSKIKKLELLLSRIKEISLEKSDGILEKKTLLSALELESSLSHGFVKEALEDLIRDGTMLEKDGHIRLTLLRGENTE